jgi:phosphate transport system substrate-binding protein
MRTIFWFLMALLSMPSGVSAQEKIVVGGSGSLTDEMVDAAQAYMAKNPGDKIDVIQENMSTTGGIEGVNAGRLTIGIISRRLKDGEKGKLVYRALTRSMAGVVVHKSLPVNGLSSSQVCEVFSGKIKSWKEIGGNDDKITVLKRTGDDNNTETFRRQLDCFKELKIAADALPLVRGSELLEALDKRPGLIGITNLGSNFSELKNIKALAVNGVIPTVENARSEKYKFYNEQGAVTLGEPQGLAKRFMAFLQTPEGQKILASRGAFGLQR